MAEALSARVVLVGDRKQHRAYGGRAAQAAGREGRAKVAEVTEILRQKGDYKKAAEALAKAEPERHSSELDKLGWIKEVAR